MTRAADREARRLQVLDRSVRVLAADGAGALTMRRIAQEVGASTQVLYTLFESKEGLVAALVEEGFRRFGAALAAVHEPDPRANLRALGDAYRRFALENPDYYVLMWSGLGRPDPDQEPAGGTVARQALLAGVTRVLASVDRPARDVVPMANVLWSASHGFVMLELGGLVGGDEAHETLLDVCVAGILGVAPTAR